MARNHTRYQRLCSSLAICSNTSPRQVDYPIRSIVLTRILPYSLWCMAGGGYRPGLSFIHILDREYTTFFISISLAADPEQNPYFFEYTLPGHFYLQISLSCIGLTTLCLYIGAQCRGLYGRTHTFFTHTISQRYTSWHTCFRSQCYRTTSYYITIIFPFFISGNRLTFFCTYDQQRCLLLRFFYARLQLRTSQNGYRHQPSIYQTTQRTCHRQWPCNVCGTLYTHIRPTYRSASIGSSRYSQLLYPYPIYHYTIGISSHFIYRLI